jgi:translation elongation factor EF-Tu-like GTPase
MSEEEIGVVDHYFDKIGVAGIRITQGTLVVGDTVHIKGHSTDFTTTVDSMQIDREAVQSAEAGAVIGAKFDQKVRQHDKVYKVTN